MPKPFSRELNLGHLRKDSLGHKPFSVTLFSLMSIALLRKPMILFAREATSCGFTFQKINLGKVRAGLEKTNLPLHLDEGWINIETTASWVRHIKKYKDLPKKLDDVIDEVNRWLKRV